MPGTDAYAGYCMAAAGFLALAHTLKRGEHIRVTLILERLRRRARAAASSCSRSPSRRCSPALFAFYSVRLAFQSCDFNDISTGNDATPLWIPQIAMAVGTLVLADRVRRRARARVARPRGARRAPAEMLHNE